MKFKTFIGIDVSKLTLDICLITADGVIEHFKIENKELSIKKFFKNLEKSCLWEDILVCAEFTGHYSNPLKVFCISQNIALWLESGAEIKLRSGVQRRKNDKIDAERIVDYAIRYVDKARLQNLDDKVIETVKSLSNERDMYIRDRAKYKSQVKDFEGYIDSDIYKAKSKRLKKQILSLTKLIDSIDKQIDQQFASSEKLTIQKEILLSVGGVGDKVATETIIATRGFTKFGNGREFSCHVGVAPFSFESGTSQRSRKKVSNRANKELKKLFHMAALSAIKMKGELREYFERKVAEGKNKMTVINAVRAKIINRIFALIRDNRKYEKSYIPSVV
ncbi:Transposase [Aquiflexum balticum DSM 16537]|uniref:Transposase n=1 Tax=Aquiflexum balticum DSM 16537 TaxID=758820 RepID=A0A1W2H867_9BACT|nr:IS110 family transposase [Aquiflexum balticum]SMD44994.1 Transposase [Aquiflexum balticum DSM 16537]SMD45195.1 Transposase [Aquiflexum balticum DSM 16537]